MIRSKPSLLFVEQDEGLRKLLILLFQQNYKIFVAETALDALSYIFSGHLPDLLLIDLNLKDISGTELIEQIRANGILREIPIITLYNEQKHWNAFPLNVEARLSKPFNPDKLQQLVKEVLTAIT